MLLEGKDIRGKTTEFNIYERGKQRHITACCFPERVIQKSLSQNALQPAITPTLAPGCSANIKGRGTDYAIKRLKKQLIDHYQKHGTDGYILLIDFKGYFASIDHNVVGNQLFSYIDDANVLRYINDQVASNGSTIGLGLGSEPNQAIAVSLPSSIDHMLERDPRIEASGRYMDDTYAISCDKAALFDILQSIEAECSRLHLKINQDKTQIIKLSHGFIFLKKKFSYGKNKKVYIRLTQNTVARARRKMRRQAKLVAEDVLPFEDFEQSYRSRRGQWKAYDMHKSLLSLDKLYQELVKSIANV